MKKVVLAVLAASFLLAIASAASAGGGSDVSSAPELPVGTQVVSGGTDPTPTAYAFQHTFNGCCVNDFWRVSLTAGDRLKVDYGSLNIHDNVLLCMLDPNVTDYTLGNADCTEQTYDGTNTKAEWLFNTPKSGRWTLDVYNNHYGGYAGPLSYELTAYVQHYTHTTITAPPLVTHNSKVTYRGVVRGASSGQVELMSRSTKHPAWKAFALTKIAADGSYRFNSQVASSGTYRIKAVYPGDANHLASSAIISFKVV